MKKIIVIGGRGSAVVIGEQIYDNQLKSKDVEFLGFAFDDKTLGKEINNFPVLCGTREVYEKYRKFDDVKFVYQMYRPDLMHNWVSFHHGLNIPLDKFTSFVHHSAYVANSAKLGRGTVVLAHSVVNSNTEIGNNTTIQSNCLIGHDCRIGDHNFFAAGTLIGSNTAIREGNFFGLNTSVNNKIQIGEYNFFGMSSNVVKSVDSDKKLFGNPAKEKEFKIKPL